MANTYKDIVITPNKGSSTDDPKIVFSGGNTSVNTDITLRVYPDSNGTLSFEGSAGQLFSVTNDLTGSLFTVNDVSGIPSIEVDALGNVDLAAYGGNVGIGTSNPVYKLDVQGDARITGNLTLGDATTDTITVNAANFNLANNVSFDSGTLFIDKNNDRIGVGTTSPTSKLQVTGGGAVIQGASWPTSGTGLELAWDGTQTVVQGYNRTSSAYVPLWLESSMTRFGIGGTERMRIHTNGNVGIGTSAPSSALTVNAGGASGVGTGLFVANGDITTSRSGGTTGAIYFGSDSGSKYLYHDGVNYYFGGAGNVITSQNIQAAIFYDTDNTYRVDPNGGSIINNLQILGAVSASTNTAFYYDAALEVRELNLAGAQADIANCAPRIGMHWGGRVASQIVLESSGRIAIRNNPGNGYEAFAAGTTYIAGNLGIGAPPDTLLYIYKDNTVAHQNYIKIHMPGWAGSANYNKSIMWSDGSDVAGIGAYFDGTSVNFSFHSMYNAGYKTPANSVMNIMGTGNVAIGTTSTSARLQVTGTSNTANVLYLNVGGNYLRANGFGSGNINLVGFENNVLIGNEYSVGDLALIAGATERMRVTSAGLVGIGTGSPGAPLTVKANSSNYVLKLQSYDSPDYNLTVNFSDASNARINATQDLYITSGYRTFFTAVGGGWGSSHTFRTANPRTYSIPGSVVDSIRSDDTFAPTANNGDYQHLRLNSTINQTGSANGNYTGIYVDITETSAKGPTNRLIDLRTGGTTKFNVANTGTTYIAGALGIGTSPSHALHVNGNAMVSGSIYNNDIRDTGGNAKLNWSVGAEYVINVHGPINNIGTHTMLAPTFSSAPRGSLVLGDGFAGDILAFKSPSTVELYDGTTWSSTTLTDAMRNLFQGKHATNYSTYTLSTAYAGIRFTYTSSDMAMYIFTNAFMISSMTQGNSCYAKMETSTDGGSTWTDYFTTASFNTWPGYTIYNHVANTNASTNRIRISIIRNGASNGNAIVLGQISLLESYQSFSNKLFNWNVNRWLGVGTVSNGPVTPQAPLDVAGAIVARSGAITTAVASSSIIDNNAGIARLISRGPDASTNGTFQLISTCSDGSSVGNRVIIDASGNMGLGATPNVPLNITNFQVGTKLSLNFGSTTGALTYNSYWDGAFKYMTSDFALDYRMNSGVGAHTWYTAPSGNAGSSFGFTERMRLDANGNVGIGTTAPSTRLEVAALNDATINFPLMVRNLATTGSGGGSGTGIQFISHGGVDAGKIYAVNDVAGSTSMIFANYSGEFMRANGSFIGIGTGAPTAKLDVSGDIKCTSLAASDGTTIIRTNPGSGVGYFGTTTNHPLAFQVQASERMRITSTGYVGIGQTNPQYLVHGYGTGIDARFVMQGTTNYVINQLINSSGNFYMAIDSSTASGFNQGNYSRILYSDGAYPMVFTTNSTERMRIDNAGNVCIGTTTSATSKLRVVAGAGLTALSATGAGSASLIIDYLGAGDNYYDAGTHVFRSTSGTTERMRITSAGNVGIANSAPVAPLHVYRNVAGGSPIGIFEAGSAQSSIIELRDGAATPNRWWLVSGLGTTTDGTFSIYDARQSTSRFNIDSSGNIGMGTQSPSDRLTIGGGAAQRFEANLGGTGTYGQIRAYNLAAATNPATNIRFIRDVAVFGNDGAIAFDTTNAERMRVTSTGNVGIGNTAPVLKLEVAGNMSVDAFIENSTTIATNYTITTGRNAMSAGPISINSGVTVTVPSGSTWTIV